jgi:outer membrane protein TolC
MKFLSRRAPCLSIALPLIASLFYAVPPLAAAPLPLQRAVELALSHSPAAAAATADEQRVFASYIEARDSYVPQMALGSGLGATWGYPLSLEGSAPSILNVNAQSPLINFALRDFVRAAKTEYQAATVQSKDQRNQVIQDTVLSYAELCKWEALMGHLQQEQADALGTEQTIDLRIREGVDNELARTRARLTTARAQLRSAQAHAAIDVLRERLAHLTGLPPAAIETVPESIPPLPEFKQADNLTGRAAPANPAVQAAEDHALALDFRARGEHKALWPTIDFAAQYALLATFNNYQQFFRAGSFQQHNATVGVVIRLPFLNLSQHAHARAADAEALHARKQAEAAKDEVSEETLKLQRSVEELAAALHVADLEYQIAQSTLQAVQTRMDAGTATLHDQEDARNQANERYNALQASDFELQRARISLLRSAGELEKWAMGRN